MRWGIVCVVPAVHVCQTREPPWAPLASYGSEIVPRDPQAPLCAGQDLWGFLQGLHALAWRERCPPPWGLWWPQTTFSSLSVKMMWGLCGWWIWCVTKLSPKTCFLEASWPPGAPGEGGKHGRVGMEHRRKWLLKRSLRRSVLLWFII